MASERAKGMRLERVMGRLEALLPHELPTQGRDRDLVHIQQLEAVADYLESMFDTQPVQAIHEDVSLIDDLREMVSKPDNQWRKSDVRALLKAD